MGAVHGCSSPSVLLACGFLAWLTSWFGDDDPDTKVLAAQKIEAVETKNLLELSKRSNKTLLLPGITGSQLSDAASDSVMWIDMWDAKDDVRQLAFTAVSEKGGTDWKGRQVYADATVSPPYFGDHYAPIKTHASIEAVAFPYDWRESVVVEAKRLVRFLQRAVDEGAIGKDAKHKLNVVTHSMGGLLMLYALGTTDAFDEYLGSVTFVAPPFRGALGPVQGIEEPRTMLPQDSAALTILLDLVGMDNAVAASGPTFTGGLQLTLASRDKFADANAFFEEAHVRFGGSKWKGVTFAYPVDDETFTDFQDLKQYKRAQEVLLPKGLQLAREYHEQMHAFRTGVPARLKEKGVAVRVICGVNAKTLIKAERSPDGAWAFKQTHKLVGDGLLPGDGRVPVQSSFLPGLGLENHYIFVPKAEDDTEMIADSTFHSGILSEDRLLAVLAGVVHGEDVGEQHDVQSLGDEVVFERLAWDGQTSKTVGSEQVMTNRGYLSRASRRREVAPERWEAEGLNPRDQGMLDSELYAKTTVAAIKVLEHGAFKQRQARAQAEGRELQGHEAVDRGLPLEEAAKEAGVPSHYVVGRAKSLVFPFM